MNAIDPALPRNQLAERLQRPLAPSIVDFRPIEWRCETFGIRQNVWHLRRGDPIPNAFQRLMQAWFFGNRWTRLG